MIKNNLAKIMFEKCIEKRDITKLTGIDRHILNRLYKNETKNIKLAHLNMLCFALNCTASDIFEYIPDKPIS